MGRLFERIRQLISEEKYLIGGHASERLEERGIMEWQAVIGVKDGVCIAENKDREPNPTVEVEETMPDGTEFKAVWAYLKNSNSSLF